MTDGAKIALGVVFGVLGAAVLVGCGNKALRENIADSCKAVQDGIVDGRTAFQDFVADGWSTLTEGFRLRKQRTTLF